jgi:hypothetical protein
MMCGGSGLLARGASHPGAGGESAGPAVVHRWEACIGGKSLQAGREASWHSGRQAFQRVPGARHPPVAATPGPVQVLNAYVDHLTRGSRPSSAKVEFFVKDGTVLTPIRAELPAYGSLGPLFLAFGLITQEDLQAGVGSYALGARAPGGPSLPLL